MPDAQTHDVITVVTGAALVPVTYATLTAMGYAPTPALNNTALLVGAHLLSGMMFSPDLDLDSSIDDRWGIFSWIWKPYARLLPHRHFWSHGLVLPPLLRLLYFYLVVMGLLIGTSWLLARVGILWPDYHVRLTRALVGLWQNNPQEVTVFAAGFITGGAAHSVADWLVTGGKRYLRSVGITIRNDYRDPDGYRYRNHHWVRSRR